MTRQKILLGLTLSIIAFLIQWRVLHLRNWTDTERIITSLLGAGLIVMAGSFAKNLAWQPVLLHRRQQSEIDGLGKQLGDASTELAQAKAAPPVTPYELEQQRIVSEKMADLTPEEANVIQALLRDGEINRRDVSRRGLDVDLFYRAVGKATRTALVKEREDPHPGGVDQYIYVNPEHKVALQHYFAQSWSR